MTIIGRDRYGDDMIEEYRYRPSACPRCAAKTLAEAETRCQPWQTPSGDYECPGETGCLNPFGIKWDAHGNACELTRRCAAAEGRKLDAWVRDQLANDPGRGEGR